jgi:alpha-D-xyloside xylohydrolase
MKEAHEKGTPVMRTMFYEFPGDQRCWEVEDQYTFGGKYLCAPVLEAGQRVRKVYLPKGCMWRVFDKDSRKEDVQHDGGTAFDIDCSIESMPVLIRQG